MKTLLLVSAMSGLGFLAVNPAEVERVASPSAVSATAAPVASAANVTPAKPGAWMWEKGGKLDEAPVRSEIWRGGRSSVFYATPKEKPVTRSGFVK